MTKIRNVLATAAICLVAAPVTVFAADTYTIDPMHVQTLFAVSHLGYSTVTGGFKDVKGTLLIDDKKPQNSSVDVTIAAASLDTGVGARDNDLKSPAFFDIQKFPSITFKSTKVKRTGDKTADVEGDFTLHGVTKPLTLKVELNREAPDQMRANKTVIGFSAKAKLKRSDFGMSTYVPYIGDEVNLTINVEALKQ